MKQLGIKQENFLKWIKETVVIEHPETINHALEYKMYRENDVSYFNLLREYYKGMILKEKQASDYLDLLKTHLYDKDFQVHNKSDRSTLYQIKEYDKHHSTVHWIDSSNSAVSCKYPIHDVLDYIIQGNWVLKK
jgi:hypothetical protein